MRKLVGLKERIRIMHDVMDYSRCWSGCDSLLQACLNNRALWEGKQVHAHIIYSGFHLDSFLQTKLMSLYVKCNTLGDARRVLEQMMPQRNVVHWNVMISAYSKNGLTEEAFTLFHRMQRMAIEPDQFTFTAILPACSHLGSLRVGKKVHHGVVKAGFQYNVFVGCALLDMYFKCGSLEDAHKVFEKMPERDVVSWNAMVAGCALNGFVDEAMGFFQKNAPAECGLMDGHGCRLCSEWVYGRIPESFQENAGANAR